MPTYVQLASEPEWGAQFTPPAIQSGLIEPLRAFYGLGPSAVGAAGDNNHLSGRHRSYAWDRNSRYCVDRGYGTSDARDQSGDRNWYRAVDVGITGQTLFDASRRMDALVRSGRAPGVAEWFGTFDGHNVVGWFQGSPSTSDSSHLLHLHTGFWNESASDLALMQLVYATITGTAAADEEDDMLYLVNAPGDPGIWMSNGITRRPVGTQAEAEGWLMQGPSRVVRYTDVDLSWYGIDVRTLSGGGDGSPGDGGGGLTAAQAEEAAFQGAQRAERE